MPPMRRRPPLGPPSHHLPLALFSGPAIFGALLGWVSERSFLSAFLLIGEPILLAIAVYAFAVLVLYRRLVSAAFLVAGVALGALAVRWPAHATTPPSAKADWIGRVQDCANDALPVDAPIRVLLWQPDPGESVEAQVRDVVAEHPHVVVMEHDVNEEVATALADQLDGEGKLIDGGLAIVVKGVFSYCSGRTVAGTQASEEDIWEAMLPAAGNRTAKLVVAFPGIEGVGVFPLIVVRLDEPGTVSEWRSWPHRLDEGARIVSAVAHTVGSGRLIVLGDFEAPTTFRHVAGYLAGAGLTEAVGPPTWPAQIGPIPFLPVHSLDRVWLGDAWAVTDSRALERHGSSRRPLLVDLEPVSATAQ
jgi:hypothetical protein